MGSCCCCGVFVLLLSSSKACWYMGKSLPSANRLARVISDNRLIRGNNSKKQQRVILSRVVEPAMSGGLKMEATGGGSSEEKESGRRSPLAEVVSDCVRRWFQDTLKEAKAGDCSMQVLVGQMYYSGYGVPKDPQKGRAWINRASKSRSSVWKVGEKHPGYNASDSDSDEMKEDAK